MNTGHANPPIILSFSSLDPSGCGGIQADIETAASLGCHCAPVITSLCSQGCTSEGETFAVESTILIEQARSILENMNVQAIKLGFVGSQTNTEAIHSILLDYPEIPVVAHPALYLMDDSNEEHLDLIDAFNALILPLATVSCLSLYEAREIAQESDTIDTTGHALASRGCEFSLITGTGKVTQAFQNSLYSQKGLINHYSWQQEPPTTDGAASTLSMSIASYIAHGLDGKRAIEQAQDFTWRTLLASRDMGFDQRTPHRFFWADKNLDTAIDFEAAKNIN
ncbi:Hydroxymethylpyrimidine/phosphomethylpyrimidine kinase [Thalassocella blandensis]|nr:Hydroxymethylpyrimidine/phosphomethylpyrimidine kinase [Thalassocella blandensis]